jgi:predicted MFS family arabinose efflux permease
VLNDLVVNFGLKASALGHLTSAVQFGFISGTLVFAILTIADRHSPSKVFLTSALLGAACNASILWLDKSLTILLLLRFLTGFFLAGIYPVGMKIAADYYEKGLGKSLGFLVGALVVGTAFPHLLKGISHAFSWQSVLATTSLLAVSGGVLMAVFVPDGPHRKPGQRLKLSAFLSLFKNQGLRSAAFGYFGHMWELYAFWAFVPVMLTSYADLYPETGFNVPVLSFTIIGIGGVACVLGGYWSQTAGTKRTAMMALLLSCGCCLLSPLMFTIGSAGLFVAFLLFWGMVVIADSPLFSTLVAQNAPAEIKATALTLVNCIGFGITIISIQAINALKDFTDSKSIYTVLAIGPIFGLIAMAKERNK